MTEEIIKRTSVETGEEKAKKAEKTDLIEIDRVIEKYADMVYRLAYSQTRTAVDADDIFQEVFVRLVSHIEKLKSWEHVKAWLIRVTVNCVKNHYSQYWNKNVTFLEEPEELKDETDSYMMKEEHPVTEAVRKLPAKYRMVVHLFYYEELPVEDIARITGQKKSTVKSQLFRAREMLKNFIGEGRSL